MTDSNDTLAFSIQGEHISLPLDLLNKYNVSVPRYTSYPTAPEWLSSDDAPYIDRLAELKPKAQSISMYTHIPFCEARCHFCGCNVVITKQKDQAEKYLSYLLRELERCAAQIKGTHSIVQYHWGGGTPTYFNEDQIERYFNACKANFNFSDDAEIAIETDPRITTESQLKLIRILGFNRISYGVQSFDPEVQKAINRIQPFDLVKDYYEQCRGLGFDAVNFDLIYGLPGQTLKRFTKTLELTVQLSPDRIALYSFAHLPNMLQHQKRMDASLVPQGLDKFKLFTRAIEVLTANGYRFIGLDHFAKENDELAIAEKNGSLHRTFMGHTTKSGSDLIALGVSSISMFDDAYFQNEKKLIEYYRRIDENKMPIHKAIALSKDDRIRREVIQSLLCNGFISKTAIEAMFDITFDNYFNDARALLDDRISDGLISESNEEIRCSMLGRLFNRNIAVIFDAYFKRPQGKRHFSKAV